jgi:hypothetical protein
LTKISMWSWLKCMKTFRFIQILIIINCFYHFTILNASFLGSIWSMWLSMSGYCSISLFRIPFCTEDLSCCVPDTLSFSSNLPGKQ